MMKGEITLKKYSIYFFLYIFYLYILFIFNMPNLNIKENYFYFTDRPNQTFLTIRP